MTYREFADKHLDPPVRVRFLKNFKPSYHVRCLDSECGSQKLHQYINHAFQWTYTPEGRDYWVRLNRIFKEMEE